MKRSKLKSIAALAVLSVYGCGFAIDLGNTTLNEEQSTRSKLKVMNAKSNKNALKNKI